MRKHSGNFRQGRRRLISIPARCWRLRSRLAPTAFDDIPPASLKAVGAVGGPRGTSPMTDRPPATNVANELARERNREASERTLMAWIRTALSLIGFGFGIGKLETYLEATGVNR